MKTIAGIGGKSRRDATNGTGIQRADIGAIAERGSGQ